MAVAQTTMKEELYRRILDLPDEAIEQVSRYVCDFEAHEPNEETIAAMLEAEAGAGETVTIDQIMTALNAGN
jgi:hypothetical protein